MIVADTSALIALLGSEADAAATTGIDALLAAFEIETIPVDAAQAQLARQALLRYGKGRHPAALNICDCFSYAFAVTLNAPLLCKGGDFARTDVKLALPAG